jgi:hypothetical protein
MPELVRRCCGLIAGHASWHALLVVVGGTAVAVAMIAAHWERGSAKQFARADQA